MGNIPSNHIRIWNELSKIENDATKLKMLETLLAGQEYVTSFKKMNLYSDLLTWLTAVRRGSWAEWPTYTPPATRVSVPTPLKDPMSNSIINAPNRNAIDYLNECYDLLGISDNEPLNLDMLKKAYKKRALALHPDKGGDPVLFDSVTKAFLYLQDVYNKLIPKAGRDHADSTPVTMETAKARRIDNSIQIYDEQHDDISMVIHDPKTVKISAKPVKTPANSPTTDSRPISINPKQLDMNVFNQLFEQNKLPDPEKDDGYGDWLASQDDTVKKTKGMRGKFSIDIFNKTFENEAKDMAKNMKHTAVTKYNSPDAIMLTPNAVVLGGEKPSEYTAPAGSGLHYTDLKAAYSTHTTFSHQVKDVKIGAKSFSQAKAERENDPGPASEEEMRHMEEIKQRSEAAEKHRKLRLAAHDTDASMYHERIKSRLLITEKSLH